MYNDKLNPKAVKINIVAAIFNVEPADTCKYLLVYSIIRALFKFSHSNFVYSPCFCIFVNNGKFCSDCFVTSKYLKCFRTSKNRLPTCFVLGTSKSSSTLKVNQLLIQSFLFLIIMRMEWKCHTDSIIHIISIAIDITSAISNRFKKSNINENSGKGKININKNNDKKSPPWLDFPPKHNSVFSSGPRFEFFFQHFRWHLAM